MDRIAVGTGPLSEGDVVSVARHDVGVALNEKDLARLRAMDNPDSIPLAYEIGRRAAERQVKAEHWNGGASARASIALVGSSRTTSWASRR